MRSNTSTGIVEFRIYGTETTNCDPITITPKVSMNSGADQEQNYTVIGTLDAVEFIPEIPQGLTECFMGWVGPNNF